MKRSTFILLPVIAVALTCFGDAASGSAIVPADLIGYWALNGDLTDSAPALQGLPGPGSDGTFTGGLTPTFVTVDGRQALDMLEATVGNNFVETQTFLDGGPKTVVLWANSTHTGHAFWAGNRQPTSNRLFFGTHSPRRPWIGAGGSSSSSGSYPIDPDDGNWHMYVLTDTGTLGGASGTVTLYQDGAFVRELVDYSGSTESQGGTRPFVIGQGGGGTPYYARAYIDDVAVFNRVLNSDEMAAIHSFGSVGAYMAATPPMPKFSWLFDGNAKAQLGGFDGTLHGYGDPEVLPTFGSTSPVPPMNYDDNQYIRFDSGDQHVNFGNDPALRLTDAITVAFWMNSEVSSSTRFILGQYTGSARSWAIGTYGSSGVLRLLLSADGTWGSGTNSKDYRSTSSYSVTDGEWHHVAFTFADNEARLYLDGTELTVGAGLTKSVDGVINTLNNSSANVVAGMRSDALAGSFYEGLLDEVAIWNSVLSPEEIKWLYHSSIHAIPEPSTFAMLLFAVMVLAWPGRRRRCV